MASIVPSTVAKTLASLRAAGIDPTALLSKLGVNAEQLLSLATPHSHTAEIKTPEIIDEKK
jgi:hypothetical protein